MKYLIKKYTLMGWRVGVNQHNDVIFSSLDGGWFSLGGATKSDADYIYGRSDY